MQAAKMVLNSDILAIYVDIHELWTACDKMGDWD